MLFAHDLARIERAVLLYPMSGAEAAELLEVAGQEIALGADPAALARRLRGYAPVQPPQPPQRGDGRDRYRSGVLYHVGLWLGWLLLIVPGATLTRAGWLLAGGAHAGLGAGLLVLACAYWVFLLLTARQMLRERRERGRE